MSVNITLDPTRDALVIVDVQNDFCPGGALAVPEGDRVVSALNRYVERFHGRGAPIFATRDWHPPRTSHFNTDGGIWPPHCVVDTRGAEFHPELRLPADTTVVSKGMGANEDAYSAWDARTSDGRSFSAALAERGIRRVFVGGLATDYCVKATALDARRAGLEVVLLEDAVKGVDVTPGDSARALAEMTTAGVGIARLETLPA